MNLILDLGNTLTKLAIYDKGQQVHFAAFESLAVTILERFLKDHPHVKASIMSSVIDHSPNLEKILADHTTFINLREPVELPLENLYKTPESLGNDRLAAAVAANAQFRNQDVLAIETGTCIKYDFVNAQNQYLGGAISPGIDMRFKALNNFTGKLPLLSLAKEFPLTGTQTNEAILSGVLNGALLEMEGFIQSYKNLYPGLNVVLSGGYIKFFEKHLKNSIFADPFLVLKGLNIILEHNLKRISLT